MKRYILAAALIVLSAISYQLSAQVHIDWTADLPAAHVPSGVTLSDVDTLTDWNGAVGKIRFSVDLDASTYDNATGSTAFNAIGVAMKAALNATYLGLDTAAVESLIYVIKNVDRTWDEFDKPSKIEQYGVAEDIYRVTGVAKYTLR